MTDREDRRMPWWVIVLIFIAGGLVGAVISIVVIMLYLGRSIGRSF